MTIKDSLFPKPKAQKTEIPTIPPTPLLSNDGVQFEIGDCLYEGGETDIYEGRIISFNNSDHSSDSQYRPKVLFKELTYKHTYSENPELWPLARERFRRITELQAELGDQHLSGKVLNYLESGDRVFMVIQPYFREDAGKEGAGSGTSILEQLPSLSKLDRQLIAQQLVSKVIRLHEIGIYHMDLGLHNMLYFDSTLRLIDFGLCVDRRKEISEQDRIPDLPFSEISPEYGSPERARQIAEIDHSDNTIRYLGTNGRAKPDFENINLYASEIFSTGLILFEIITGKRLLDGYREEDLRSLLEFDLSKLKFDLIIKSLNGFSDSQKQALNEAFRLILVDNPQERLENFPAKFLAKLEIVFAEIA